MFTSSLSLWRKSIIYVCILIFLVWHALIKARKPELMTCEMLYQAAHRQAVTVKGVLQQGRALTVTGVLQAPPGRRPWLQIYQADLLLEL